jgi:hypothetical protein
MASDLIASGRIVDAILVLMVLELAAIAVFRRMTGRGPAVVALLPNFAAGACLVLALRAALTGSNVGAVSGWLLGALIAHALDLASRWGGGR